MTPALYRYETQDQRRIAMGAIDRVSCVLRRDRGVRLFKYQVNRNRTYIFKVKT